MSTATLTRLIVCALLASAIAAPAAIARPIDQERYLQSYGTAPALDDGTAAAKAQEDYYQSYGPPQNGASDGIDWVPIIAPTVALALALGIAGAVGLRRRSRAGHPRARVAA